MSAAWDGKYVAGLVKSLRQKAAGQRNDAGDVWGDWICLEAAQFIDALTALLAAAERLGREAGMREAAEVMDARAAMHNKHFNESGLAQSAYKHGEAQRGAAAIRAAAEEAERHD